MQILLMEIQMPICTLQQNSLENEGEGIVVNILLRKT